MQASKCRFRGTTERRAGRWKRGDAETWKRGNGDKRSIQQWSFRRNLPPGRCCARRTGIPPDKNLPGGSAFPCADPRDLQEPFPADFADESRRHPWALPPGRTEVSPAALPFTAPIRAICRSLFPQISQMNAEDILGLCHPGGQRSPRRLCLSLRQSARSAGAFSRRFRR
jgi:hypothetical protein